MGILSRTLKERPIAYQAPSWPWASINTPLALPDLEMHKSFEIEDCRVNVADNLRFREVYGGVLKVKGHVPDAIWSPSPSNNWSQNIYWLGPLGHMASPNTPSGSLQRVLAHFHPTP